ncbi:MAG TPA: DUF5946 family protein [Thermomicrobiaceae bacterium]|nr:DUF5946 family protein [Thermomicrobiaceae bacterium]
MTAEYVTCPGCGLTLPATDGGPVERSYASAACWALCMRLSGETMSWRDPGFVHQLAVDAYAAQHYGPRVKPITITFALVGLYLVNEHGFSGRQVQRVHMALANRTRDWPAFQPVAARATLMVSSVVDAPVDAWPDAVARWSSAVWQIWRREQATIAELLRTHLDIH